MDNTVVCWIDVVRSGPQMTIGEDTTAHATVSIASFRVSSSALDLQGKGEVLAIADDDEDSWFLKDDSIIQAHDESRLIRGRETSALAGQIRQVCHEQLQAVSVMMLTRPRRLTRPGWKNMGR